MRCERTKPPIEMAAAPLCNASVRESAWMRCGGSLQILGPGAPTPSAPGLLYRDTTAKWWNFKRDAQFWSVPLRLKPRRGVVEAASESSGLLSSVSHLLSAQLSKPRFITLFCARAESLIYEAEMTDERMVVLRVSASFFYSDHIYFNNASNKTLSYRLRVEKHIINKMDNQPSSVVYSR